MKQLISLLALMALLINIESDSAYFGPQIRYKNYYETLPCGLKSTEKGYLYGFRGGIAGNLFRCILFDLYTEFAEGKTEYRETKQSLFTKKIAPFKSSTDNRLLNLEGDIGLRIAYKRFSLKPFWGLGYHLWERKMEDYKETFSWPYFAFGGALSLNIASFWDIGFEGKGMQPKFANIGVQAFYPWKLDISLEDHLQYCLKLFNKFCFRYLSVYLSIFYEDLKIGPGENIKKSTFSSPLSQDQLIGGEFILEYNF